MKITIEIPDSAVPDVELYEELEHIKLQHRIQQEVNKLLKNIIWYVEEAKKTEAVNAK